ncbi:unnamed protein product [Rhizoctonia solani]|uniref:Fungal lipase-type domain-containing protein n=1 Tax=Rhizoctonia solani TaxID=456999 RepID=A0A8H3CK44_9AGAM|nr:unnamed protein product [Rhizoctonia solani]
MDATTHLRYSLAVGYVGYHAGSHSVVVGNQGSDFDQFEAVLVNAEIFQKNLDATLFPGISENVKAHSGKSKQPRMSQKAQSRTFSAGFIDAQAMSAAAKLAAVQLAMTSSGTSSVTLTGHSLGGAISLLDSLYLSLNLPSATIKTVTHGMPRVGNREFADLVDSKIPDLSRITNMQDLVPILPGRLFGYAHPSGEKHIVSAGGEYILPPPPPPPPLEHSQTNDLKMQQVASYFKQAFLYPGAMIATPIVAVLMVVAIGGGALDDAIFGGPDSLRRWWNGTLSQKKRVQVFACEETTTHSPRKTRKLLESAFEQLESHARKQRRKRLAEQASASLSVKPAEKQSTRMSPPAPSPRVIGTRRRRSRGGSGSYDMEMQAL